MPPTHGVRYIGKVLAIDDSEDALLMASLRRYHQGLQPSLATLCDGNAAMIAGACALAGPAIRIADVSTHIYSISVTERTTV